MITLKIKVTKEILEKTANCPSNSKAATNCAVAVAIRDIFPKAWVERHELYFDINDVGNMMATTTKLPKKASGFIQRFDSLYPAQRKKMKPIEFEITIPDNVIEKINIEELRPLLENHPTLELIQN
jgi:hypothetical protein